MPSRVRWPQKATKWSQRRWSSASCAPRRCALARTGETELPWATEGAVRSDKASKRRREKAADGAGGAAHRGREGLDQFVVAIAQHEPHSRVDGGVAEVVEDNDPAGDKQLVGEEEIDQRVVKSVPTIDEDELCPRSPGDQFGSTSCEGRS